DDIARNVVEKIQATLSEESRAQFSRPGTTNLTALEHYLAGRELLRRPKTPDALERTIEEFELAIDGDPAFAEASAGLCEAYLARYTSSRDAGSFDSAEGACLRAASLDDSLGEVYAALGNLYRVAGRVEEAEFNLLKALELMPNSAAIMEELGRNYRASKKLVLAEQTFRKAIEAEPASWAVYKSMGNFLFRTGRYTEALPYYRQVITLEGDNSSGYNNLAVTNYMLGNFDDANFIWSNAINDSPSKLSYTNYANSLYYTAEYERSADMYAKALAIDENDHRVWQGYAASLRFVDGREQQTAAAWKRAIELAEASLSINPDDTEALSHIAVSYARVGNTQLATRALERAVSLGWENPNYSFYVALAYHLLERSDDAIRELERAVLMGFPRALIEWDPDFQRLAANQRYVALLENGR
ncbi:MAG: tetratricopeptide repeat protein, partial [Thiohalocapsa sp.]